jgi:hypothetical protein
LPRSRHAARAWMAAADMNTAPMIRNTDISSCQSVENFRK